MVEFARDQSDEAVKWLSTYADKGLPDYPQSDSSQYKYLSLEDSNYIRLLVFSQYPSPNDNLKDFLRHIKLDNSPPLKALLYTWENPAFPQRRLA
jgi:hypothetical protein